MAGHAPWRLLGRLSAEHRVLERHRAACLACQAEATRQRSLSRRLGQLRTEVVAAPAGLAVAVMSRLEDPVAASHPGRRVVASAAVAAAVAAAWIGWRRARHA